MSTKADVAATGDFDTLLGIIEYLGKEEWEFNLTQKDGLTTLTTDLFDGKLNLRSNGTWALV